MITDFLIFPAIFAIYISLNLSLRSLGINNNFVLFALMFLFLHLLLTVLMYYQLRSRDCEDIGEYAAFAAVFSATITILSYTTFGFTKVFRYLFYPLMFLPYNNVWLDHFIVSLSTTGVHVFSRYIITQLADC